MPKLFRLSDLEAEEENEPPAIDWEEFSSQPPTVVTRRREKAEDPAWLERQEASREKKNKYQARYRETHRKEVDL